MSDIIIIIIKTDKYCYGTKTIRVTGLNFNLPKIKKKISDKNGEL